MSTAYKLEKESEVKMSKKLLQSPIKKRKNNTIVRSKKKTQSFSFAKTIELIREHTRIRNEVVGVIYVTIALIAIAGLTLDDSGYVRKTMDHFTMLNGVGPLFLISFALFYGSRRIYGIAPHIQSSQLLVFPIMYLAFIGFVSSVISPSVDGRSFGGIMGNYIYWYFKTLLGVYSSRIILFSAFLISFMHITEIYVSDIINFFIKVCYETGNKVFNYTKLAFQISKKSSLFLLKKIHFLIYTIMNDLIIICERGFSSFRDSVFQKTLHYEGESWDSDLEDVDRVEELSNDLNDVQINEKEILVQETIEEEPQKNKTIIVKAELIEAKEQVNKIPIKKEEKKLGIMQKMMDKKKSLIVEKEVEEIETSVESTIEIENFKHLSKEEVIANNNRLKKVPIFEEKKEEEFVEVAKIKVIEDKIIIKEQKNIENEEIIKSSKKLIAYEKKQETLDEVIEVLEKPQKKKSFFEKVKSKIKTLHEEPPVDEIILEQKNENTIHQIKENIVKEEIGQSDFIEESLIEVKELDEVQEEISTELEETIEVAPEVIQNQIEAIIPEEKIEEEVFKPRKAIQPSIDFLMDPPVDLVVDSDDDLWDRGSYLIQTLETYKINALLESFVQGPTITRFELKPAPGTKLSKIVGLTDEIKMALEAKSVRVEAPIPGTNKVGIEIPNANPVPVFFKEVAESITGESGKESHPLDIAFGKGIAGNTVIANLAKMPHMLIAGATGSGKSVCINTLISSILFKASPDQVQFIMIDPKQVELAVYRGIPHLITDVVTDPSEAAAALQWGVDEMERRYTLLSNFGVRHIDSFNEKVLNGTLHPIADIDGIPKVTLPYIVIIVDELADLMMVAKKEVETSICRIAQKARAIGIHLVIATQRPSVDVITGLIKANLPSRIAFMVSSGIDSKTILNQVGAEHLLGKGDCLYFPAGQPKPDRVQGAFMNDDEVAILVDTVKRNYGGAQYQDITSQYLEAEEEKSDTKEFSDEKYNLALEVALRENNISTSMLQRHLGIGYNRAARIVDVMFARGVCGKQEGGKKRKVLITESQLGEFLI
ncbi:MAG: hypothetical protein COB02_09875 [Candidatus Cloacimonadota bacterium]|nr:MAG: hypothetical protein COB02_09875 [Candidatus Cloacimonadota bacterium]